ncbi:MAG TPA: hypothetical protein VNV35_10945 [Puia sp.]|jgi:hypothetical protein|nr:hypothetical protein [Puia sp.]
MKEQVLNIISILVGIVGIGSSILGVHWQRVAEREMSNMLRDRSDRISELISTRYQGTYSNNDSNIMDIRVKVLLEEVKQVAEELPKKERAQILNSLEQKSPKGQVSYLNKLLHMSGSNMNISTHS